MHGSLKTDGRTTMTVSVVYLNTKVIHGLSGISKFQNSLLSFFLEFLLEFIPEIDADTGPTWG